MIHQQMEIPNIPEDGDKDVGDDLLKPCYADSELEYFETHHDRSVYHALFYTMWHTAYRNSGTIVIDAQHFKPRAQDYNILAFVNRRETGTTRKNGNAGQRKLPSRTTSRKCWRTTSQGAGT